MLKNKFYTALLTKRNKNTSNTTTNSNSIEDYVILTNNNELCKKCVNNEVYHDCIHGFHGRFTSNEINQIKRCNKQIIIEKDFQVKLLSAIEPSWGIDIIDGEKSRTALNGNVNCDVFVLDTGVNDSSLLNLVSSEFVIGSDNVDRNGHGSLVAHIIGTATENKIIGVAPNVRIHSIKVLNDQGWGTVSSVIAGIERVVQWKIQNPTKPVVMNLSLGGPVSRILDIAVTNAIRRGITVVVAAGNSSIDVSRTSPARVRSALVVGSYNQNRVLSWYSNFGRNIKLLAPGDAIVTLDKNGELTSSFTGTSAAAPHVAGAAALLLHNNQRLSPLNVRRNLVRLGLNIINVRNRRRTTRRSVNVARI